MTTIDLTKTPPGGDDDQPERRPTPAPARVATSPPLLPMWLRDRETLVAALAHLCQAVPRRALAWLAGLAMLVPQLAMWAPRGLARLVGHLARWIHDQDSATLRHKYAGTGDDASYRAIHSVRKANLHARMLVVATASTAVLAPVLAWLAPTVLAWLVGVAAGAWLIKIIPGRSIAEVAIGAGLAVLVGVQGPKLLALLPLPPASLAWWLAGLAVLALGWYGRPLGKAVTANVATAGPPPLRAPLICEALASLGNAKMSARTEEDPRTAIRLLSDVHRHGPGVQADLELPAGVPATWVMEKREELAAALRRELGCVWPAVGPRHPGHLVLYVADQPMSKARQSAWPLAKVPRIDIFDPQPVATDQRGRWVNLPIAYSNGVIGAVPRQGKTFALRELALIAGMDPRTRVYAFDGKGTGDLSPLAPFAHYVGVGDEPEDIAEQLGIMRGLRDEMRRRARLIRDLPREEAPESKVTSALVSARRDLAPACVFVDETQVWFQYGEKGNKEHKAIREEFAAICTDLVKRGPALGIWLFLASQQVNADTIPTSISNNAVIRICLKIFGQVANDQILGTSARKEGVDATIFATDDKGIAYLRADGADAQIVRTVHGLDAVVAEGIAQKIRAMRLAAGLLTGQAAGEPDGPDEPQPDLLEDVYEVIKENRCRNTSLDYIRGKLGLLRPGIYGHLDNDALGLLLRGAGVTPDSIHCPHDGRTMRGVKVDWVTDAIDAAGGEGDAA